MNLEIRFPDTPRMEDGIIRKVDIWEGVISEKEKKPVFWVNGDDYEAVLIFEDEGEIDKLIEALQYFKKKKTFPPTE